MPYSSEIPFENAADDGMWMLLILTLVAAIIAFRWWRISKDRDRKPPPQD